MSSLQFLPVLSLNSVMSTSFTDPASHIFLLIFCVCNCVYKHESACTSTSSVELNVFVSVINVLHLRRVDIKKYLDIFCVDNKKLNRTLNAFGLPVGGLLSWNT